MKLTRAMIERLLSELGDELARAGLRGEVFIVGGAAMVLALDARPSTMDIDAIFRPASEVRAAAARVAAAHDDVPEDWLNDGVKGFLPAVEDPHPSILFERPSLSVSVAGAEYLLAMKLLASRVARDDDDILTLCGVLGITDVDEGLAVLDRFYPGRPIEAKVRFLLTELLGDPAG